MNVRIYQPAKTAMQSGRSGAGKWILEYEDRGARRPEPLMGWTSAPDTLNQVQMTFETKEQATTFATAQGWDFTVATAQQRRIRPRNYVDNFRYSPPRSREKDGTAST